MVGSHDRVLVGKRIRALSYGEWENDMDVSPVPTDTSAELFCANIGYVPVLRYSATLWDAGLL